MSVQNTASVPPPAMLNARRRKVKLSGLAALLLTLAPSGLARAQQSSSSLPDAPSAVAQPKPNVDPIPKSTAKLIAEAKTIKVYSVDTDRSQIGIDITSGSGGVGIDITRRLSKKFDLSLGASTATITGIYHDDNDGVDLNYNLTLGDAKAAVNYHPFNKHFEGLYLAGGVMVVGMKATSDINVHDNVFELFSIINIYPDPDNKPRGKVTVSFPKPVGPYVGFGYRKEKGLISYGFEVGVAFLPAAPTFNLSFQGSACFGNPATTPGFDPSIYCVNLATDPGTQLTIAQDNMKYTQDISFLQRCPKVSFIVAGFNIPKYHIRHHQPLP